MKFNIIDEIIGVVGFAVFVYTGIKMLVKKKNG
jgi:hypothetical protein